MNIVERTVTNLSLPLGLAVVRDQVRFSRAVEDGVALAAAFEAVSLQREFEGLVQLFGGTASFMIWLAEAFNDADVRMKLVQVARKQADVEQLCYLVHSKVRCHSFAFSSGKDPVFGLRAMLES